jgi:hypothetical protein
MVSISSSIFSVNTAFHLVYFLFQKNPVECTFFTNSKIADEAGTRILMAKPS